MEFAFEPLSDAIERHLMWAGPILGLVTFGESLLIVGAFFPATALMLLAGSLAAVGLLDPAEVLLWCLAGAIAGDAVSYWIGRAAGPKGSRHPLLSGHRKSVARARLFIRRYGVASIFLCRFMGPVRAVVPTIAGITAMGHSRFQLANVGSAIVWVPVMLAPGYLATRGYNLIAFDTTVWSVAGLGAIAIASGLAWAWASFRRTGKQSADRAGAPARR